MTRVTKASDPTDGLASYRAKTTPAAMTADRAIEQFVQGAVLGRAIYCVVGADGIATVSSPTESTRATCLFWSHSADAERWADALVATPKIIAINAQGFLGDTVPAMIAAGVRVGLDWSSELIEAELEPQAIGMLLREELARDFAAVANKTRFVWVVENADGIASITGIDGGHLTPIWADRHVAEETMASVNAPDLVVARRPLLDLTNRYLLSTQGLKSRMAPAYVHAEQPVLMSAWAFKALLNGGGRPSPRIAASS